MWSIILNFTQILITVILGSIGLLFFYYKYSFNHWKKLGITYPEPSFPLGNMHPKFSKYISQSIAEIYKDMKQKGVSYCGYFMFASPIFMPISLKMNKQFLTVDFQCFQDRGFHSDEINDPMGASLITFSGEKWKKMREKLSPTFTLQKTKMMLPIMVKCTEELENIVNTAIEKGQSLPIQDILKRYTVDVICSCAFGVECNCLKDPKAEFIRHAKMIFTTSIRDNMRLAIGQSAPAIMKLFKMELFNPTATRFFKKVVEETVEYREKNNIEREDFINLMIKMKNRKSIDDDDKNSNGIENNNKEDFTINEIAAQCFLFFIAGFETVSACLSYTMIELSINQNIQEKTRKEIKDILRKYNGEVNYESIKDMIYLEAVINESLRKNPVVTMLNRIVTKDFQIPDTNIIVEEGTRAVLSTLGLHKDPEYYPDPEKFDPDRFLGENREKIPPFAYIPFGDGPRICPGLRFGILEVKICIAYLLNKYRFKMNPSITIPIKLCSIGNVLATEEIILLDAENL